jgi:xylan 1,4-beta-xylosidase
MVQPFPMPRREPPLASRRDVLSTLGATLLASCTGAVNRPVKALEDAAPGGRKGGAQPPGASHTFKNPILPGFYPDPSICRVGEDYYLVTSSFEYFPGVPIFHSRDLVNWHQIGHVLTRESQLPLATAKSSQGIFAPSIRHHEGTFYVVTTNVSGGGSFYVTARDPAGAWSEPTWLPEASFGMDPSLFFDEDGHVYYTRHGGGERGGAYQAELDLPHARLDADARQIWAGTGGVWPEGPHLYKIGGRYYLLISEGGTSTNHMLTIARSASPFGPFEAYAHNPILTHRDRTSEPIQATGHGDLVQTADGHWWLVFLGIRRWDGKNHHLGRETFLAPVEWNADGWPIINGNQPIALDMSDVGLPPRVPWPVEPARDDFSALELGFAWNFLRNPARASWSLSERPGFLRLHGSRASLDEIASPAFVGQRQRHHRSRAQTRLEFSPTSAGQRAGLTVRANEENHYDLVLTRVGAEQRIQLWTRVLGRSSLTAEQPLTVGAVELTVEAFPDRYEFAYAEGSSAPRRLGSAGTAPLSSESAGGFTGVYFGMFASTGGTPSMPAADFDWFEYRAVDE